MKLKIANLSKRFGNHQALDQLSLNLEETASLALIGPSGGGKTTLLRLIAGLEIPDQGTIELNGESLLSDEAALLRRRRSMGVVFQGHNLFPHLTALQNITLPLEKVHGHAPAEAQAVALELLRRFHLAAHAQAKPASLSGGQSQRVAIARAVAIRPRLLLFDEPTSALDPEMTAEVLDMIQELRRQGHDLIIITHEMGFAKMVAEQTAFLAQGRILEYGPTAQVFSKPSTDICRRFLATVLKYE